MLAKQFPNGRLGKMRRSHSEHSRPPYHNKRPHFFTVASGKVALPVDSRNAMSKALIDTVKRQPGCALLPVGVHL